MRAGSCRLQRSRGRRKVWGVRRTGQVNVEATIYREADRVIEPTPADEAGEVDRGSGAVKPRHKDIGRAAKRRNLAGSSSGCGECGSIGGRAGDIDSRLG